ncbi:MAG: histidine kinase [Bacteroidetes bacterium]|nr:histidine kinase [Bacteroidota bacterium]
MSICQGRMTGFLSNVTPSCGLLERLMVVILTYTLKYALIAFITQNGLLKLLKEELQFELNALKAQIHPHFLFNTLNNLYSLTLKNSDKASEVVLKLSDIMRYVLYQAKQKSSTLTRS